MFSKFLRQGAQQTAGGAEAIESATEPTERVGVPAEVPVADSVAATRSPETVEVPAATEPSGDEVGCDFSWSDGEISTAGSAADQVDPLPEANPILRSTPARKGRKARALELPAERPAHRPSFGPEQRLLLLDTWRRSGLPAGDFAALVGISKHTLYTWNKRFEELGPAGLVSPPRGAKPGSRLPELTRRTILMLKQSHPEWGCQRISDVLARGPALPASASAVARVLHEAGYESVSEATRPHPPAEHRFERARPNQLWQTDLFTFMLKRQNRRVYLVAFMDDHSRFIVSYGLHASQSTALVLEVLEAAIANYGAPEEILTDNGPQYVTWRGKSQFTRQLEKRGIRQIVARPRRPQTLGKIERFWGTLWREVLETAVFIDLADARRRIGLYLDHYNFFRGHQGLEGLVPADRFFHAAPEVLRTLKARVAANGLELARNGVPREPFYLTGQLEGKPFSIHREGERLILIRDGNERQEVSWEDGLAIAKTSGASIDVPMDSAGSQVLPAAVCPDGSPAAVEGEPALAPPAAPGESAMDRFEPADARSAEAGSLSQASDREQGGAR